MKKYKITKESLNNPLKLNFCNIEGSIIPITIDGTKKILKVFQENHDYLENKWYTIDSLEQASNLFDDRFILPEMLAVTDRKIGYIMRYVNNINLENFLKDYNISLKQKIKYLKEICLLLEECKRLRKTHEELSHFYIGDLHVNNLLYNIDTKKLNICDMDSCRIGQSKSYCYRYLSCSKAFDGLEEKYLKKDETFIPNENSDIYCAIMIIMNFIYNGPIEMMDKKEFNEYLNYLDSLQENGIRLFDKNLLYIFSRVYENRTNINPIEFIDSISEKALARSNSVSYYYSKMKTY